jgi:hypothetical protein
MGTVACEIGGCGVPPIGRCASCGRAFCGTHQALSSGVYPEPAIYRDRCTACQAELQEASQKARTAQAERVLRLQETVRISADPIEVMRAVLALPPAALNEPFPCISTVGAAWAKLVDAGKIGIETQTDLVTMRCMTSFRSRSGVWQEVDRTPAWQCGNIWIDGTGWAWEGKGDRRVAGTPTTVAVERGRRVTVQRKGGHLFYGGPLEWWVDAGSRVHECGRDAGLTAIKALIANSLIPDHDSGASAPE